MLMSLKILAIDAAHPGTHVESHQTQYSLTHQRLLYFLLLIPQIDIVPVKVTVSPTFMIRGHILNPLLAV